MGTMTEVSGILDTSPLAGRLNDTEAHMLSVDLNEIGKYLAELVEELGVLHTAVLTLATRVDEMVDSMPAPQTW